MEELMISIPVSEYKELLQKEASIKAFENFVNRHSYTIEKEECGAFLGFRTQDINVIGRGGKDSNTD